MSADPEHIRMTRLSCVDMDMCVHEGQFYVGALSERETHSTDHIMTESVLLCLYINVLVYGRM